MQKNAKRSFAFFQTLSKVLMLPFIFLPTASILLGLSYWLKSFNNLSDILHQAGSFIILLIPYLFITSITHTLSKDKDVAIVPTGIISYVIFKFIVVDFYSINNFSSHLSAIIIAFIVLYLYELFKKIKMPSFLVFFEGRITSIILTILSITFLSFPFTFVFKYLFIATSYTGNILIDSKIIGPGIFGIVSRLLIPTGLHHIWHNFFWFDTLGINGLPNYLLGIGNTNYLAGLYLVMIFGLPGAALAMIKESRKENRKSVKILMTSAILSSLLFGITEPIEFSFLLVSPLLFIFHALMTGLAMIILNLLNVTIGFSFSAGIVDLLIQLKNPINNLQSLLYIIPIGVLYLLIYYIVFRIVINKLNLATPGRSESSINKSTSYNKTAVKMIEGLGGKDNIVSLDYCATRLRLVVKDQSLINDDKLKDYGALSVLKAGSNIQVVVGPEVSRLASFIDNKYIKTKFLMPLEGEIKDISETADEVFSEKLLGPGFVIIPTCGLVKSPINGKIQMIYPSKHAIGITNKKGVEILIHIGIDTVELNGEGFNALVKVGDIVKMGDSLMEVDLDFIKQNNKDISTPVVFLQKKSITVLKERDGIYTIEVN